MSTCACGRPGREFSYSLPSGERGTGSVCQVCMSDDVVHSAGVESAIAMLRPKAQFSWASTCVLAGLTQTFCGQDAAAPTYTGNRSMIVTFADWFADPEAVQHGTCEQCLLRLFMLGDSAKIALERMGRRVEVVDAPDEAVVS